MTDWRSASQTATVTRRAFVVGGVTLGGMAGMPALALAQAPMRPAILLFDCRIEDGRRFAALAAAAGQVARDTGRDVAPLLYGKAGERVRDGRMMLAGVTRYADYQIASAIGREAGRKVVAAFARGGTGGRLRPSEGEDCRARLAGYLGGAGLHLDSVDDLVREAGSIVWICA